MLLRNMLARAPSGELIAGTPYAGLMAPSIISETETGDHGAGLLYNEALAQTGRQLRVKITSWSGTAGTLFVYENGSVIVAESQADGAFSIGYDWEAWADDGSLITGSDTADVTIGPQSATAPGASVTGSGTISAGSASGQQNATAPGASVTGSGTVTAGDASGGVAGDATAPGATLYGASNVVGGVASGQSAVLTTDHIPQIVEAVWAKLLGARSAGDQLQRISSIVGNKMVTDPATGTMTVYGEDDTTPILSAPIYKDAAGTTPYDGTGAERRERLA